MEAEFLVTQSVASALGATSRVQDIEGLEALPTIANGSAPSVLKYTTSADNRNSMSIEFNKLMNEASVESALTFTTSDVTHASVDTMKIWIKNALHLIPDLDDNGTGLPQDSLLDLGSTTPMTYDTSGTIAIAATAVDRAGTAMGTASSKSFRTAPYNGWYISEGMTNFAGAYDLSNANVSGGWYDFNVFSSSTITSVPANFRLQFKAKNTQWYSMMIGLYDRGALINPPYTMCGIYYSCGDGAWSMPLRLYIGNGAAEMDWASTVAYHPYSYLYNYDSTIFNGNWMYYRLDVYGSNARFFWSENGSTWTELIGQPYSSYGTAITNLVARPNNTYSLVMRVHEKGLSIDDLNLWKMDSAGVPESTAFYSENFDGRSEGTTGLLDAPNLDGTVQNKPKLTDRVTTSTPGFTNIDHW
jgi:hypothetical protein